MGTETNPFMREVTEQTVNLIDIMKKGDFSILELRKVQNTFRAFDALIEEAINEVAEELRSKK